MATIGEIAQQMWNQVEANVKNGMSRKESLRAVFNPVVGQRLLTGFPSIDAVGRPDYRRGLSVTGDARHEVLGQMVRDWAFAGLRVVQNADALDAAGDVVIVDFADQDPPDGSIYELRKRYRDRVGLVLLGDDEITDPMFDEVSAITIKFDYVTDEAGNPTEDEIVWLITYVRDGPQFTGRLKLDDDKRWVEQPDTVKQTGRYFMI